ncbi:hypothetical protein ACFWSP_27910, partial [Streptomyces sp. NPDC058618]|uniref:hypothetical protein n=1 Tax=Streptomyces sp. NPDC058618 TaxID=3346558 RepID=UPI00365546FB
PPPPRHNNPGAARVWVGWGGGRPPPVTEPAHADRCTSVPGLYAAGDLTSRWKQSVTASVAAGAAVADAIHVAEVQRAALS